MTARSFQKASAPRPAKGPTTTGSSAGSGAFLVRPRNRPAHSASAPAARGGTQNGAVSTATGPVKRGMTPIPTRTAITVTHSARIHLATGGSAGTIRGFGALLRFRTHVCSLSGSTRLILGGNNRHRANAVCKISARALKDLFNATIRALAAFGVFMAEVMVAVDGTAW